MAPNVLTFSGFLFVILNFAMLSYYDYYYVAASAINGTNIDNTLNGHTEVIPRSLWWVLAVFLFLAYTLGELETVYSLSHTRGPRVVYASHST